VFQDASTIFQEIRSVSVRLDKIYEKSMAIPIGENNELFNSLRRKHSALRMKLIFLDGKHKILVEKFNSLCE